VPRLRTLDDLDVAGRRVLVRADFNVPLKEGRVADPTRIARTLPTLEELVRRGGRPLVLSHLGRPKGKPAPELSLAPVAQALAEAAKRPVAFARDCVGREAEAAVARAADGGFVLFENVRFHAGEEKNDAAFAGALAALGEAYVNDAFACAHRAHASTEALARLLPAAAGRLMQAEIEALERALESPARPLVAVVGGAKVSTKLEVLENLLGRVDALVIGGAMANTFLLARGADVGRSLVEPELVETARRILESARAKGVEIALPVDAVVARALAEGAEGRSERLDAVPADAMILDIGPRSVADLSARIEKAATVVWNGPLGAFEVKPFDAGTNAVARAVARLTREGRVLSVAGGGDTVAALAGAGVEAEFSYVSTAGGAFLEWLEGRELPGVAALRAKS
jgi:phosphoglycerate kinase